jgi:hypothetical protein
MTFTEAAVEVLRLAGKPLHYKKITEIAIERNLLSHVGKTPETTMSSRLATMVKKDRGDAPIIKVKPGVFALRDVAVEEAGAESTESGSEPPSALEPPAEAPARAAAEVSDDEEVEEEREDSAPPPSPDLPGADVFPEEEDDDELILANLDEGDSGEGRGRRGARSRNRRRRDRRPDERERRADERTRRPDERARRSEERERRSDDRENRGRSGRMARLAKPSRSAKAMVVEGDWSRSTAKDEIVGQDLADAIEGALRNGGQRGKSLRRVAEVLIQSGRLSGEASDLGPTLAAAVRGDNARRSAESRRPRFRELDGELRLSDWDLPMEAVKAEAEAQRAAQRQRDSVHRALLDRLRELPDASLMELLATWLNAVGVHSLRGVRSSAGDFSLAGSLRRGPEELPIAIVVFKSRQSVGRDAVVELRGALHRFDHARAGWILTLGQANREAFEEARAEGAAPCAVFDGKALAAAMESAGVGARRAMLPLAVLDIELLNSLAGPLEASSSASDAESEPEKEPAAEQENDGGSSSRRRRSGRRRGRRRGQSEEVVARDNETAEESDSPASEDAEYSEAETEDSASSDRESGPPEPDLQAREDEDILSESAAEA